MANRVEEVNRMRDLQRARADHAKQLDDVLAKIAQADERRKTDRDNQRKWNRVLDQLERSMDELKALIASCDGEILQIQKRTGIKPAKVEMPPERPKASPAAKSTADALLRKAEDGNAGRLRAALEKGFGGKIGEVTLKEAGAMLDEYELLVQRSDLTANEAKVLDAIRSLMPVVAERMQEWQIRWSRSRKS